MIHAGGVDMIRYARHVCSEIMVANALGGDWRLQYRDSNWAIYCALMGA